MGKKRGYYIHFDARQSSGVSKKIDMQMKELGRQFSIEEIQITASHRSLMQRVIGLFPLASIAREYERALHQIETPDFIYMRRAVADHDYMQFLKEVKDRYPECKIIVEIFTYPYDRDDFGKWNAWPFYLKELLYRKKYKEYLGRFVTYSNDKEIFGVPTICTTNGVDTSQLQIVTGAYRVDQITLIGVAYMQRQHGYERIIRGLRDYYKQKGFTKRVYLYLAGDGPEKKYYQQLVKKYGLEAYVKFFPNQTGEALDQLYEQADIALASFGFYKAGVYHSNSSLKVCECLAKGLPFVTGCSISGIEETCPYMLLFPNGKGIVDICQIVTWFEKLQRNENGEGEMAKSIRKFAEKKFDMKVIMRPVIQYIESVKDNA